MRAPGLSDPGEPVRRRVRLGLARAALVLAIAAAAAAAVSFAVDAFAADVQYEARGRVVGFGPQRAYVSVAHEDIPGYMSAMTMSFEPRRPAQIAGAAVGDRVMLSFTAAGGGHRWIDSFTVVAQEPSRR